MLPGHPYYPALLQALTLVVSPRLGLQQLGTISLREFKATFSIVVCELGFKYGVNYTEAFAFKHLACYVHYEALDVYE